jgi:hypothetical protein
MNTLSDAVYPKTGQIVGWYPKTGQIVTFDPSHPVFSPPAGTPAHTPAGTKAAVAL